MYYFSLLAKSNGINAAELSARREREPYGKDGGRMKTGKKGEEERMTGTLPLQGLH